MASFCTRILLFTVGLASSGLSAAVEVLSHDVVEETPYCMCLPQVHVHYGSFGATIAYRNQATCIIRFKWEIPAGISFLSMGVSLR